MTAPFDPYHLTPTASLNRLRIVSLPGIDLPDTVINKTGWDLISAQALSGLIRADAAVLHLPPDALQLDERALPLQLNACFESNDNAVRAAAHRIRQRFAQHIAYLLLVLKRGDTVNRAARVDWDSSYWEWWEGVETVVLGGGLLSGHLGAGIEADINSILNETSITTLQVIHDPHGSALPLIGAARIVPQPVQAALVLDFGGSFIKRACAVYADNSLSDIRLLSSVPTRYIAEGESQQLFDFMVRTIADSWRELAVTGITPAQTIPVSIASYLSDGQPLERQGGAYTGLRIVTDNLQQALTQAVSARLDTSVSITLLHDGSASALAYNELANTAVITIGTAMGIGFPPRRADLCPIAPQVVIRT